MKNFILCMKKEVRDEFLKNGFKLISTTNNKDGEVYTFENNEKFNFSHLKFSEKDIIITNKLMF